MCISSEYLELLAPILYTFEVIDCNHMSYFLFSLHTQFLPLPKNHLLLPFASFPVISAKKTMIIKNARIAKATVTKSGLFIIAAWNPTVSVKYSPMLSPYTLLGMSLTSI